jgi:hypothetical protein
VSYVSYEVGRCVRLGKECRTHNEGLIFKCDEYGHEQDDRGWLSALRLVACCSGASSSRTIDNPGWIGDIGCVWNPVRGRGDHGSGVMGVRIRKDNQFGEGGDQCWSRAGWWHDGMKNQVAVRA